MFAAIGVIINDDDDDSTIE